MNDFSKSPYLKTEFGTQCVHAGTKPDKITGAVVTPLSLATTFAQLELGKHTGFEYSRTGNPSRLSFEESIAVCENGKYALAFSSGSATTTTIVNMLSAGDGIISISDVYGGTNRYFNKVAKIANNLQIQMIDFTTDLTLIDKAVQKNTKLIWVETPTNPTLRLVDIKAVAAIAKKHNLICVVDNTFASPYIQQPLNLGADIVVHSGTKYLGGHSDVVIGCLVTNNTEYFEKLKFLQNSIGAICSPFDCYLGQRGLKTLHLRMREHCSNGLAVAKYLESRSDVVEKVIYPGLKSHPQHALAKVQMNEKYGGMVTFYLKPIHSATGLAESKVFLESLKLFLLAESLGCVECLAEHPALMTHAAVPPEQRKVLGISDNMIRFSVGVESERDIINDIKQSLDAILAMKK